MNTYSNQLSYINAEANNGRARTYDHGFNKTEVTVPLCFSI